jgi:hypothetical protein
MRSVVCIGTFIAAAVAATACNNNNGPYYNYPIIGGSYTGTVTYQMLGDQLLANSGTVVPGIAIQMNDPNSNGVFNGTFQFNTGYTGSGDILGQFSSDGGSISWDQFGDDSEPLFYVSQFLTYNYPACNFLGSSFNLNQNGGFDGNGNLILSGTYTGIRCGTGIAGDSDTTTMNVALSAFNPAPDSRVVHALGLRAVQRARMQRVK